MGMHFAVRKRRGKGRKGEKGTEGMGEDASLEINFWLRSCLSELVQQRDEARMVEVLNSY